jgi:hypothetical protein
MILPLRSQDEAGMPGGVWKRASSLSLTPRCNESFFRPSEDPIVGIVMSTPVFACRQKRLDVHPFP